MIGFIEFSEDIEKVEDELEFVTLFVVVEDEKEAAAEMDRGL